MRPWPLARYTALCPKHAEIDRSHRPNIALEKSRRRVLSLLVLRRGKARKSRLLGQRSPNLRAVFARGASKPDVRFGSEAAMPPTPDKHPLSPAPRISGSHNELTPPAQISCQARIACSISLGFCFNYGDSRIRHTALTAIAWHIPPPRVQAALVNAMALRDATRPPRSAFMAPSPPLNGAHCASERPYRARAGQVEHASP